MSGQTADSRVHLCVCVCVWCWGGGHTMSIIRAFWTQAVILYTEQPKATTTNMQAPHTIERKMFLHPVALLLSPNGFISHLHLGKSSLKMHGKAYLKEIFKGDWMSLLSA